MEDGIPATYTLSTLLRGPIGYTELLLAGALYRSKPTLEFPFSHIGVIRSRLGLFAGRFKILSCLDLRFSSTRLLGDLLYLILYIST